MIGRAATSLRLRAADARETLTGRRDRFTPPRRMSGYVGHGDFQATGAEFLGHFRDLAGLRPQDRVLEMGCGIGRMARVLVGVLRPPGAYDGFDIVASGVAWCRRRYRDTPAPFRFTHADLRNTAYNPQGALRPEAYRFPYDDGAFDLVIATSLFTHLLSAAADHYLAEAARVLAPGGRLFATWLLFSPQRPAPAGFTAWDADTRVADPGVPEDAIAFGEDWLTARLTVHGLSPGALAYGTWAGHEGCSFQDIIVAHRG